MAGWLDRLLGRGGEAGGDHEHLLALRREAQDLRLHLDERSRELAALREALERQRSDAEARSAEVVRARVEQLLTEVAGPVAQLVTQGHLLEAEGKPIQARDILAVARRLVRVLEDEGLALDGRVGERVPFDPDRHAMLGGVVPAPGQTVVIRFVGITCRGRVLRKAGVERVQG
jgi:molecular chaperone GrpE (heat shock protein)